MKVFSPGRLSRMCVCFASVVAGVAYATVYVYTESRQFEEQFFASFILRTIHAFLSGAFVTAIILYRYRSSGRNVTMICERRPVLFWFAALACVHLIAPLLRAPTLLFTGGTGIFLLSTAVSIYLAGGWNIAIGTTRKTSSIE